jgi:hypothetical protein
MEKHPLHLKIPGSPIFSKTIETDARIQSPEQAKKALFDNGDKISSYAEDMLNKVSFSEGGIEYNLVEFSVEQLGFPRGAKLSEIYARAKERGLELCPAEVGPLLRLQYTNQPEGNYLRIAMEPLPDRDGDPSLFFVPCDYGESWLNDDRGHLDDGWRGDDRFVFLSRK